MENRSLVTREPVQLEKLSVEVYDFRTIAHHSRGYSLVKKKPTDHNMSLGTIGF